MADVTLVEETVPVTVVAGDEWGFDAVPSLEWQLTVSTRLLTTYPPRYYGSYESSGY